MLNGFNSNIDTFSWMPPTEMEVSKPEFPDSFVKPNGVAQLLNTAENLSALLDHLKYRIQKNSMNLEMEALKNGQVIFDSFETLRSDLIGWCSRFSLPKSSIDDHLNAIAERNSVHPIRSWLDDGKWDGIKRVEAVISCLNAKDRESAQIVLRCWLTGCVASLYEKRFSSKLVPVIQGEQSYMKTTAISRICSVITGSFLEGAELNPDIKDSVLSVIKSWICELGELERTSRNSQGSLKAFITRQVDTVRPPYSRTEIHKPRKTHLIATVNGTNFLKDDTGNSRYGVIELEKAVDIEKINDLLGWHYNNGRIKQTKPERLRQFWLEIKHYYDLGESWNLTSEQTATLADHNDKHADKGTWYEYVEDRFVNVDALDVETHFLKAGDICQIENIDKRHSRQLGQALKRLSDEGKLKSKRGRANATFYEVKIPSKRRTDSLQ